MKKYLSVFLVLSLVLSVLSLVGINQNIVKAAEVGDQLHKPEDGWKRYEDNHEYINIEGNFIRESNNAHSGETTIYNNSGTYNVKFKFKGTSLRLIGSTKDSRGNNHEIIIDGESYIFSQKSTGEFVGQTLNFEINNLEDKIHTVEIKMNAMAVTGSMAFDAIDINTDGKLIDPSEIIVGSIELNKTELELEVGSSESLTATITPESVTNKIIKWTSSDPEIATVDDNGNVIAKKPGKVTITAATTDGSNLTATCEVNVYDGVVDTNRAVLRLTTTTGQLHEYDLSITEINNFISWIDSRGQSKPYYKFNLNVTVGNVEARTEYIMFDKIVSFVVDEYK